MGARGAALAARRLEGGDRHAQRQAGAAAVAVGPVGEHAAAPKAVRDQARVGVGVDQVARRRDLRARHAARQVAARVGRRRVELQRRERELFRVGHGRRSSGVGGRRSARDAEPNAPTAQIIGPIDDVAASQVPCRAGAGTRARGDLAAAERGEVRRCAAGSRSSRCRARGRSRPAPASAIFDASVRRANIDSPKNMRPRPTPYRPPASSPSIQVSKLCDAAERVPARSRPRSSRRRSRCRSRRRAAPSRRPSMTRAKVALSMRSSQPGVATKRRERLAAASGSA